MKKLLILALVLGALTACSSAAKTTLKVYNWGEYIDMEMVFRF